jgi:hypothetical protein
MNLDARTRILIRTSFIAQERLTGSTDHCGIVGAPLQRRNDEGTALFTRNVSECITERAIGRHSPANNE